MKHRAHGFTIVELLIVIVIIGVLAVISIVTYASVQKQAHDNIVRSDVSSFQKKMELSKIDLGHYPQKNTELPDDFILTKSSYDTRQNNIYYVANHMTDRYALGVRSVSGAGFIVTDAGVETTTSINGARTAQAIGLDSWGAAEGTYLQGYSATLKAWQSSQLKIVRD